MKHHRTVMDCACPVECYREAKFRPEHDKKIQEAEQKYQESHARLVACNIDAASRDWEESRKKALEGAIDDAKKAHISREEFFRGYQELERQEMDRHLLLCRTEVYPVLIPHVETAREICLAAAKNDEDWARQASERVKVPYVAERDEPYSSLALKMKARQLESIIGALKRGEYGQGGPFSILQTVNG